MRKVFGAVVLGAGCLWMLLAQGIIMSVPVGVASDAPAEYQTDQSTFSRDDLFLLSRSIEKQIRARMPNVLYPALVIVIGSWMLFGGQALTSSSITKGENKNG